MIGILTSESRIQFDIVFYIYINNNQFVYAMAVRIVNAVNNLFSVFHDCA